MIQIIFWAIAMVALIAIALMPIVIMVAVAKA